MNTPFIVREDALRDTLLAFGGRPGETEKQKHARFAKQAMLYDRWPDLHKALMNLIGLDEMGHPLPNPVVTYPLKKE